MALSEPLRPDCAFVIQLQAPEVPQSPQPAPRVCGRVEHVASGRSAMFETALELLEFMGKVPRRRRGGGRGRLQRAGA